MNCTLIADLRGNRRKKSNLFLDALRHMITADRLTFEDLTKMPRSDEHATWIPDDSPNNSALAILRIVKEEGNSLGAVVAMEKNEEKNISNTVVVSLKMNGKVFRLTLSWVRDECLNQGSVFGQGYIQTDLHLRLRCKPVRHPSDPYGLPPFLWHVKRDLTHEQRSEGPPFPPERILDEDLLRQLICEKLGV